MAIQGKWIMRGAAWVIFIISAFNDALFSTEPETTREGDFFGIAFLLIFMGSVLDVRFQVKKVEPYRKISVFTILKQFHLTLLWDMFFFIFIPLMLLWFLTV